MVIVQFSYSCHGSFFALVDMLIEITKRIADFYGQHSNPYNLRNRFNAYVNAEGAFIVSANLRLCITGIGKPAERYVSRLQSSDFLLAYYSESYAHELNNLPALSAEPLAKRSKCRKN